MTTTIEFIECVPPFTHDVCVRVVRLALPPVLREPRDVKPAPPAEPACSPSCRMSVLCWADRGGPVAMITPCRSPFRSVSRDTSVGVQEGGWLYLGRGSVSRWSRR
jgi:hypothetical protein